MLLYKDFFFELTVYEIIHQCEMTMLKNNMQGIKNSSHLANTFS